MQALADGAVIARRNVIKIRRVPEVLVFVVISPIMFVLLFAYVFGGSIDIPGGSYREFLIGGIFAQTVVLVPPSLGLDRRFIHKDHQRTARRRCHSRRCCDAPPAT
jgi:hypothetical protein